MATTVTTASGKTTVTIKYAADSALMTTVLASIGEALLRKAQADYETATAAAYTAGTVTLE